MPEEEKPDVEQIPMNPIPSPKPSHIPVAIGKRGLIFTSLDEQIRFANGLIAGGIVPAGMKPGAVVGILQAGAELGMPPMWSLAHLTFVRGRLGIDGTGALALVRNSNVCRPDGQPTFTWKGEEWTPGWTAVVTAHRRDRASPVSSEFSIADAQRMGLLKLDEEKRQLFGRGKGGGWTEDSVWANATPDMLQWRAWARMHKREFADVVMGLQLTEELRDLPSESVADAVVVGSARARAQQPALDAGPAVDPLLEQLESRGQVEYAEIIEKP